MNKNLGVALVVILVIATAGAYLYPKAQQPLGAQSESVTDGSCYNYMGVQVCPNYATMKIATTTVCALRSPSATSTLLFGSAKFKIASSSATIVTLAKSSSPSASTTLLASSALGAGAQGTIITMATSTNLGLDSHEVFAPNTYFNVSVQAGDIGGMTGLAASGSCNATFEVL